MPVTFSPGDRVRIRVGTSKGKTGTVRAVSTEGRFVGVDLDNGDYRSAPAEKLEKLNENATP